MFERFFALFFVCVLSIEGAILQEWEIVNEAPPAMSLFSTEYAGETFSLRFFRNSSGDVRFTMRAEERAQDSIVSINMMNQANKAKTQIVFEESDALSVARLLAMVEAFLPNSREDNCSVLFVPPHYGSPSQCKVGVAGEGDRSPRVLSNCRIGEECVDIMHFIFGVSQNTSVYVQSVVGYGMRDFTVSCGVAGYDGNIIKVYDSKDFCF